MRFEIVVPAGSARIVIGIDCYFAHDTFSVAVHVSEIAAAAVTGRGPLVGLSRVNTAVPAVVGAAVGDHDHSDGVDYLADSDFTGTGADPAVTAQTVVRIGAQLIGEQTPVIVTVAHAGSVRTRFEMVFSELLARIRALLRRQPTYEEEAKLAFGDLVLDTNNCCLINSDNKVTLMNKELQIMTLLMKANGNVVSQDTISKNVWDIESYSTSENVWVFISYLRKKLDSINSKVKIKSIRYQGYYLEYNND